MNLLFSRDKNSKADINPISVGIGPVNTLSFKLKYETRFKRPISVGICDVIWLLSNVRPDNVARSVLRACGIVPVNVLLSNKRSSSCGILLKSKKEGIVPPTLFELRSIAVKSFKLCHWLGTPPVNPKLFKSRDFKPDKFDRSAGRVVDVIGFPPTARKVKDGNVAIADQFMVPTSLLSSISIVLKLVRL